MIGERDVIAIIIGRAGSKGLPGKNTLMLGGRPMVRHSIDHARRSMLIDRIAVSTDSEVIADAARGAGDVTVIDRPADLGTDWASVQSVARHALQVLGERESITVILYVNVPIRPPGLIDGAVRELIDSNADSVQSYTDVDKHHPAWMCRLDAERNVLPYQECTIDRRQDLPQLFIPDGGVIAVRSQAVLEADEVKPHSFLGTVRHGVQTQPGEVVDIDNVLDLAVAEAILAPIPTIPTIPTSGAMR